MDFGPLADHDVGSGKSFMNYGDTRDSNIHSKSLLLYCHNNNYV
jgi:hypothetical protein